MFRFHQRIRPAVRAELDAAAAAEAAGCPEAAFRHLERAHVLGQPSTRLHVLVHLRMLRWGLRHRRCAEVGGQALRLVAAATKSAIWVPRGNTGGSNVSPFRSLPIPHDLQRQIDAARR